MQLESPTVREGEWIPRTHTGEDRDRSPALNWGGPPAQTRSFVLILDDPDAPAGVWVHWVLFDIPKTVEGLPEGIPRLPTLENGSRHGSCWGVTSFDRIGYFGPQPPPGPPHRYRFTLTALDRTLDLPAGASPTDVRDAMAGHGLATATLTGLYGHGGNR